MRLNSSDMYMPASTAIGKSVHCNGGIVPPTSLPTDSTLSCTPPMSLSRSMAIHTNNSQRCSAAKFDSPKIQSRHWLFPKTIPSTIPTCCLVSPKSVGPLYPVVAFCQFDLHEPLRNHLSRGSEFKWVVDAPPAFFRCCSTRA